MRIGIGDWVSWRINSLELGWTGSWRARIPFCLPIQHITHSFMLSTHENDRTDYRVPVRMFREQRFLPSLKETARDS
jgi:hypothetical protein